MAARLLTQVDLPGTADEGQITQEARPTRSLAEHPERRAPLEEETTTAPGVQASAAAPFVVDGLVLAAEQMVYRALERAGNKLKNRMASRSIDCEAAEPGVYHLVNQGECTWAEFTAAIYEACGLTTVVNPVDRGGLSGAMPGCIPNII